MHTPRYAIVVAGGKGLRMGGELPKQFLTLGTRPVLMHTLDLFTECDALILALPLDHQPYWQSLCNKYGYSTPHIVCDGGDTRYHSVSNALEKLSELCPTGEALVAVHDGVRPFASRSVIDRCYIEAERSGAALPYRPVTDSLRMLDNTGGSTAVNRSDYVAVQTPQTFHLGKLRTAYQQGYQQTFTDDASVWERAGYPPITLVEGNSENIKLTTPIDLYTAQALIQQD